MGSIVLDATTDYIRRQANLPPFSGFTMSGWVKFTTSTSGTQRFVCGVRDSAGGEADFQQWTDDAYIARSASISNPFSTNPVNDVWVYVALTHDTNGPVARWWNASGTLQATTDGTPAAATGTPTDMAVGNRPVAYDAGRVGKYAYWKVWDAVLTATEIAAEIFATTFVRTTNANTGFADSATDISGNGRNWTLSGTGTDSDTPPVSTGVILPSLINAGINVWINPRI